MEPLAVSEHLRQHDPAFASLADKFNRAMSMIETWEQMAERYKRERDRMADALQELHDFLDDYIDVVDGDYGQPKPNKAMNMQMMIDEVLGRRP